MAARDTRPTRQPAQTAAEQQRTQGRGQRPASLRVRAIKMGYYGHKRRREGDVFTLADPDHFSAAWMVSVPAHTPERVTTGQQELRRQHDEILGAKLAGMNALPASQQSEEPTVDPEDPNPLGAE